MLELIVQGVPVKRGILDKQVSYVASMTFGDIARLLDGNYLYVPNQPDLPDLAQRKLNPARIKAIAMYILENYHNGTIFFPPICINIQPAPIYKDGRIFLPYQSVAMRLTDGQHRCFGIREALIEINREDAMKFTSLSQIEVGVLFYSALSLEEERQAFRDQNLLVQRPSVSLAHYFDRRSPAVLIAKELIERVPQFQNNVEQVENGLSPHNPKLITLSTLVTATKYMFPNLKNTTNLELKINWAVGFWQALVTIIPCDPWQIQSKEERHQQRQTSLIGSAVVFQALGILAHDLYLEGVPEEELIKWLARLEEINWLRDNEFWRERGVTQIGATGEPIISNTKTTVSACHRALQELVGLAPTGGVL
jgi:DNA sulfur modification protein DndB